ncbi:hypothetical protein LJC59_01005 [Desulfovibrio sp. OttesenSCG-928-A18]|nr:hypothetical protein [Desulfovibrio sp. OttesenSCG-928-A18]
MMAVNKRIRFRGGGYMDMSLYFDEIPDAFRDAVMAELSPVMDKMVSSAKQKVHVGSGPRDPRPVYEDGKYAGESWTSRDPGRLKKTIRRAVHRRKDKTAVIGFFEAGSEDAYYALMHEYKNPYFESSFNENRATAMNAVIKALDKVTKT